MANQSEFTTVLEEITKMEIDYRKILELRKEISEEDKLTVKLNAQLARAHKSNWKLNAKEEFVTNELNVLKEIFDTETNSIESCLQQSKYYKEENEKISEERKDRVQEEVHNFENKFHNSYNEYESKNLMANTQEYRDEIKKKLRDLNNVKQVEGNLREKVGGILENPSHEKGFTFLNDAICTEESEAIEQILNIRRILKVSNFKYQQHEETIKEFLNKK